MYFFLQTSWKHGLSKKIALEYDLSCIIGKDDISFNRKYDLTPRRKMKDNLSKKIIHENMIFSLNVLKRWSSQKGSSWDMIFFVLSGKVVFFSRKHGIFSRTENKRERVRESERERERERRLSSRNTRKHGIFYLICSTPACQKKNQGWSYPAKGDWHSRLTP